MSDPSGRSWLVEDGDEQWVVVYLPGMPLGDWLVLDMAGTGGVDLWWVTPGGARERLNRAHPYARVLEAIIRFDREMRAERDTHFFGSELGDWDAPNETKCGVMASNFAARDGVTCRECLDAGTNDR